MTDLAKHDTSLSRDTTVSPTVGNKGPYGGTSARLLVGVDGLIDDPAVRGGTTRVNDSFGLCATYLNNRRSVY